MQFLMSVVYALLSGEFKLLNVTKQLQNIMEHLIKIHKTPIEPINEVNYPELVQLPSSADRIHGQQIIQLVEI